MDKIMDSIRNEGTGEKASEILHVISYFGPDDIHTGMFSILLSNPDELKQAFELLKRHSLIEFLQETVVRIDKAIQTRVRTYLRDQNKEEDILKLAIRLISLNLTNVSNFYHAMSVFEHAKEFSGNVQLIAESTGMGSHVITGLTKLFRHTEASSFGRDVFDFAKRTLGEHHSETFNVQHNMGTLLGAEGKYREALELLLPLYEKDVEFSNQSEVIQTLVTIARSLSESSKYAEALPYYDRLLRNSQVSNTHDKTLLTAWHDYALLLKDMDMNDKALRILREVLQKVQQMLSAKDDESACLVRSSIAHVLLKQGKLSEALEILEEVYRLRQTHLGEMHADTLRTQRDLACALMNQGDYDRALALLTDVVGKFDQVLGELHPDTLLARANIATTFSLRCQLDEAHQILTDVYLKQRRVLVEHQIKILSVKHNIGSVLLMQGKSAEAFIVLQEALEGFLIMFGPAHWETLQLKTEVDLLFLTNKFKDSFAETIHSLARDGDFDKVASLIQSGEDVNAKDDKGKVPLHYAAEFGRVRLVKLLLERGAAYNAKDNEGRTPLQLAKGVELFVLLATTKTLFKDVKVGNFEKIQKILRESNYIVNVKDNDGYTPLHWAAFKGRTHILRLLLESGADATLVSNKGNSPLHVATAKGHGEIVEMLVQYFRCDKLSVFINDRTKAGGNSPLHVAAERGFADIVRTLLKSGAAYDIRNRDGKTPVEVAKDRGVCNLLELVDSLFKDATNGNSNIVDKFEGVDPDDLLAIKNARDSQKHTLLQVSIRNKHQEVARKLLKILKGEISKGIFW